jgi:hypothetical protein
MAWLVEKRNDTTGIAVYILSISPGCMAWTSQRHQAKRFPSRGDAEKAAGQCDYQEDERIIVRVSRASCTSHNR